MEKFLNIEIVPNSSEVGNTKPPRKTKQITPSKRWCFTLNNYTEDECSLIVPLIHESCSKAMVSYEVGDECGTPHLQGFIEFKTKKRPCEVFKFTKRFHWEKAKADDNAQVVYISKQGKGLLISIGMPKPMKPLKIITELYDWQKDIENISLTEPDDRVIHWYWESTGGVGKSAFVKYMVIKHKALFCDGGKKSDIINLVFNNDMNECSCIIWDIPRASRGSVSYSALESIKNGLVCNTKYETGVKAFNAPHIFVFANFPPDEPEKMSSDRWVVTELCSV